MFGFQNFDKYIPPEFPLASYKPYSDVLPDAASNHSNLNPHIAELSHFLHQYISPGAEDALAAQTLKGIVARSLRRNRLTIGIYHGSCESSELESLLTTVCSDGMCALELNEYGFSRSDVTALISFPEATPEDRQRIASSVGAIHNQVFYVNRINYMIHYISEGAPCPLVFVHQTSAEDIAFISDSPRYVAQYQQEYDKSVRDYGPYCQNRNVPTGHGVDVNPALKELYLSTLRRFGLDRASPNIAEPALKALFRGQVDYAILEDTNVPANQEVMRARTHLFTSPESTSLGVLISGNDVRIDSEALERQLGLSKITMATEEQAAFIAGHARQSICPLGHPESLVVIDAALQGQLISVGTGYQGYQLQMRADDLSAITGGRFLDTVLPPKRLPE